MIFRASCFHQHRNLINFTSTDFKRRNLMGQTRIKIAKAFALTLIAATFASATLAQTPSAPAGGAALVSEPGKAGAVRAVEDSAKVVGIDKVTRTMTRKDPKGDVFDIVASDEVKNFDQTNVGADHDAA